MRLCLHIVGIDSTWQTPMLMKAYGCSTLQRTLSSHSRWAMLYKILSPSSLLISKLNKNIFQRLNSFCMSILMPEKGILVLFFGPLAPFP